MNGQSQHDALSRGCSKSYIKAYEELVQRCINNFPERRLYLSRLKQYLERGSKTHSPPNQIACIALNQIPTARTVEASDAQPAWTETTPTPTGKTDMIVVTGFPRPETIGLLGSIYELQPEIFLRHMEFDHFVSVERSIFDHVVPPSQRTTTFCVRLAKLGRGLASTYPGHDLVGHREEASKLARIHQKNLFSQSRYEHTRCRQMNVHNTRYFSVEQQVTFTLVKADHDRWTGIFFLDGGARLGDDQDLPWKYYTAGPAQRPEFLPAADLRPSSKTNSKILASNCSFTLQMYPIHTFHPFDDRYTKAEIERAKKHPFVLLSRLFQTALHSWTNIVNFIEEDASQRVETGIMPSTEALLDLRFNVQLLERISSYLREDSAAIEQVAAGPWLPTDESTKEWVHTTQESLLRDYNWLLCRSHELAHRFEVLSSLLLSAAGVAEAQRSIQQAEQVSHLTWGAFVLAPMALTSSIFGMNVHQLTQTGPEIWVFVLTALMSSLFMLLGYWIFLKREPIALALLHSLKRHSSI